MSADHLSSLLSFPADYVSKLSPKEYDKLIRTYLYHISAVPASLWTKPIDKQNILDLLHPTLNTIPWLLALLEQYKAIGKDKTRKDDFLSRIAIFFTSFDRVQVRYVAEQWVYLWGNVHDLLYRLGASDLSLLSTAMLRLDPTAGTFTSTHLYFLRLCLRLDAPSQALPILDKNIYAYPQIPLKSLPQELLCDEHELSNGFIAVKSGFTQKLAPEEILEYYLVGAHVYIGQRNFKRARLFLEHVLLTPTHHHTCSALQVEAYKKWVLVGLLGEGKLFPLPRTHDQAIMKSIKFVSKPYDALADAFEKRDWRKYHAEMDVGTQIWHEDGNLRLVREAGDALLRYRVIDLQKTYSALPVGRVATHLSLSPNDTLQMLSEMIRQGYVSASITPGGSEAGDATLRFHASPPGSASADAQQAGLEAQTKRIEDLVTFVRDADRRLQLTKEYVEYQKRAKRSGGSPDRDLADQMDLTWDAPGVGIGPSVKLDADEDIMAG